MEFGRVAEISGIDLSLPEDDPSNEEILPGKPVDDFRLWLGLPAWGDPKLAKDFYPQKTPATQYLKLYSKVFSTVELNTSHYRIPTPEQVTKWKENTPEDFVFIPKFPQTISHERNFTGEDLRMFQDSMGYFEKKLGPSFIQFPPSFRFHHFQSISRLLEAKEKTVPWAMELRSEDTYDNRQIKKSIADFLRSHDITSVITDVPGRRDVCHSTLTTDSVIVRFMGHFLHETDFARIDEWILRIHHWKNLGIKKVFFFVHQNEESLAPELANYFSQKWQHQPLASIKHESRAPQLSLF